MRKQASTSNDAHVKELLDTIKRQNETITQQQQQYNQRIATLESALQIASQENKKRAKEIEVLGKGIAGLSMIKDDETDFTSIITEEDSVIQQRPRKRGTPPPPREETATVSTEQPTLRAKDAIRYIPVLNGDDDVGVEDFIKEVKSLKNMCIEQSLLLKAIKVEKIIGKAAQNTLYSVYILRNIPIDSYLDLYDALRTNVAVQASADEFNEQLRELKQGATEAVQSFNIRFRKVLNKLTYAITNEYPQPITRRVMMEATMKRVTRIYINGLKREIGHLIFTSKPATLIEAEKEAADVERYLREERHDSLTRNVRERSGFDFDETLYTYKAAKNNRHVFFFSCGNSSLRGETTP